MNQLFKILEIYGLPTVIAIALLIWAYYKDKRQEARYDKVCSKINDVQGEQSRELLDISIRAVTAQTESTNVQKETVVVNKELITELRKITEFPCAARNM